MLEEPDLTSKKRPGEVGESSTTERLGNLRYLGEAEFRLRVYTLYELIEPAGRAGNS